MEEEEIEREPLPGEKILPRMRRAGMDSDGDRGTDPLGEVDELESGGENGNATGEKKVARRGPPKITLVVNKGKGKDGVPQADGRRRKKAGTGLVRFPFLVHVYEGWILGTTKGQSSTILERSKGGGDLGYQGRDKGSSRRNIGRLEFSSKMGSRIRTGLN